METCPRILRVELSADEVTFKTMDFILSLYENKIILIIIKANSLKQYYKSQFGDINKDILSKFCLDAKAEISLDMGMGILVSC